MSLVNGHTLENVEPLQSQIEAKWPPCLWSGSTGTENRWYQQAGSSPTKKKLLFHTADTDLEQIRTIAQENDLDLITSVDKYLDFMPQDVNKG